MYEHDLNLLPPADLAGEIERLQDGLRIERDRNLRTLADFKNYRRRIERDGNKLAEEGKRSILLPLLDIIDDMEKALPGQTMRSNLFQGGCESFIENFLHSWKRREFSPSKAWVWRSTIIGMKL